jgi:hypothetical protein
MDNGRANQAIPPPRTLISIVLARTVVPRSLFRSLASIFWSLAPLLSSPLRPARLQKYANPSSTFLSYNNITIYAPQAPS